MTGAGVIKSRTLQLLAVAAITCGACTKDPDTAKRKHFESGNRYLEQNKLREAIVEYRNAINLDPRYGEARLKLAAAYVRLGDPANAIREQIRAADLLPENANAQIDAGNLLLLVESFEDAKARGEHVLERDPANVKAQILVGNALAGLKDFDAAIKEVEEALKLDPDRVDTYANLGSLQLARGDRVAAEETLKRALARSPSSVEAQLALANFFWSVGRTDEAEALLLRAAQAAPGDSRPNRALANLYLTTKRLPDAERYLIAAVKVDQTPQARFALADYYMLARRPEQAEPLLRTIAEEQGWEMLARVRLAAIDLEANRVAQAEGLVDEILKTNPSETEALLLKASILVGRNQTQEAVKQVERAVESNPRSAKAFYTLGKLAVAQRRTDDAKKAFTTALELNPRAADAQVELARLHLTGGAVDTSVDLAGQAVKNDPASFDARLVLARGFIARRDFARGNEVLQELLNSFPRSAAVHTQLGVLHAFQNERSAARREFDEALAIDGNYLEATAGLVGLDLAEKRPDNVRARVAARVARTPNDSDTLLLAGRAYAAIGDTPAAEDALRKAIDVDPGNLSAYESLGGLYVRAGRLHDALLEFGALASRQNRPVASLTMVGLIQQAQNKVPEAKKTYERVLGFDPEAPVAANNLALIYLEVGENLDVALQLAKIAKSKLPKRPEIMDTLGWILYHKGFLALAIRELEEAVQRDPGNAMFQFHLGLAHAKNGNRELAKRALETALRLQPGFDGAEEAARVLATL